VASSLGSVGIAHRPVDIGVLEAVRHPAVARETSLAPYLVPGSWRPFDILVECPWPWRAGIESSTWVKVGVTSKGRVGAGEGPGKRRSGVSCTVGGSRFSHRDDFVLTGCVQHLVDDGEGGSGRQTSGVGAKMPCNETLLGLVSGFLLFPRRREAVLIRGGGKQGFVDRAGGGIHSRGIGGWLSGRSTHNSTGLCTGCVGHPLEVGSMY